MSAGTSPYSLSFTAASLRPELARIIAEEFLASGDWETARERVLAGNALQARSARSGMRLERELRQRLQKLTGDQLGLVARSSAEDRAAMSWLAMLKYSSLAFDLAAELLRDKLAAHDPTLRRSDYTGFLDQKSVPHPELAALAETSKAKVRQVLLLMLAEAGLLVPARGESLGTIQRPVLSPALIQAIIADERRWLAGFLVPDAEIIRA